MYITGDPWFDEYLTAMNYGDLSEEDQGNLLVGLWDPLLWFGWGGADPQASESWTQHYWGNPDDPGAWESWASQYPEDYQSWQNYYWGTLWEDNPWGFAIDQGPVATDPELPPTVEPPPVVEPPQGETVPGWFSQQFNIPTVDPYYAMSDWDPASGRQYNATGSFSPQLYGSVQSGIAPDTLSIEGLDAQMRAQDPYMIRTSPWYRTGL